MLPTFHAGQRYVYQNLDRFNLLVCGRRWRKTSFSAAVLAYRANTTRGKFFLWGSPTHDQNKIAFSYIKNYYGDKLKYNQSDMTITFPSQSKIIFRSLHKPDNARGFTLHGVCLDECAFIDPEAWTDVLRPTLMDTRGWAIFTTTPNGYNWIYDITLRSSFKKFIAPSLGVKIDGNILVRSPHPLENDTLSFEELDSLYRTMDSISFRQEILAEFTESSINIFSGVIHLSYLPSQSLPSQGDFVVAGIDFAKTSDYTAISIFKLSDGVFSELFVTRLPHCDYSLQVQILREYLIQYNVKALVFDKTGVGAVVEEYLVPVVESLSIVTQAFTYSNQEKLTLMNNMLLLVEKKKVLFTDDPVALSETIKFIRKQVGNIVQFVASEGHDDCVNARALGLYYYRLGGIF